jgi:hypothetical protein
MAEGFYPRADRAGRDDAAPERVGVVVIHGVGETEAGWMNELFIPRLAGHPESPTFDNHSEVYDLPDRGRNRPGQRFKAYVRRGQTAGGRPLAVMELTWGDLSRIGTGALAHWLMMLKLFYEAPQVLGDCFFDKTKNGLATAIAPLVRLANWILRWPITGLNIVALLCAVALLTRQKLIEVAELQPLLTLELSHVMAVLLTVLAVLSLLFARWRVYRDIALTDIGMSTMMFSALSAVAIIVTQTFIAPEVLSNPAIYLMAAGLTIFAFWLIWNYAIFIAILLLGALAVQQVFAGPKTTRVPVIRPAAAVSLSVAQGVIYKIVIALLWIFIFVTLDFNERTEAACLHDPLQACAYLADVQKNLVGIVVFNLIMVAVLGVTFFLVAMIRSMLRVPARRMRAIGRVWMPRMVVNPLVIFVLLAGTLFNLVIFYWRDYIPVDLYKQVDVRLLPWQEVVKYVVGGGSALSVAFYGFRALQHASRGILHIVRDLVDHQFTPRFTLSRYLLPRPTHANVAHPRRSRIETRLDVLLKEVVEPEKFDRLVFVAHSQGSVILHDYLSTTHDDQAIRNARAIDVLTLGSPLTHLYQYYFARYAATSAGPEALNPRLTSWTNIWRVDDPIGNRIELFDGDFIRNAPLRPGGHVDYWKERDVVQAIVDLMEGRPAAVAMPAKGSAIGEAASAGAERATIGAIQTAAVP